MRQNISESAKKAELKIRKCEENCLHKESTQIIQALIDTEVAQAVAERDKRIAELTASNEKMRAALTIIAEFCEAEGSPLAVSAAKTARAALAPAPKDAE